MDHWIDRAQSAEARLSTIQKANDDLKAELREMKDFLGISGSFGNGFRVDFDKLVTALGDQASDLKRVIEEKCG